MAVSDRELPWGQLTEGRRTDDIRAIGLLLYQLLAGRASGATVVDPPTDGRLRFQRNIPPELCEVVARTVVRQHPKHINTVETLITELKSLAETFEPPPLPIAVTASGSQQTDDIASFRQFSPAGTGRLVSARPTRDTGLGLSAFRSESGSSAEPMRLADPTVADVSPLNVMSGRQTMYSSMGQDVQPRRLNLPLMLLLGLVLFGLFFVVGYFLATTVFVR